MVKHHDPQFPGRPSRDQACIEMAAIMARRSTCQRKSVGVVIALEGRVLVTGYNGAPAGMQHCSHMVPHSMEGFDHWDWQPCELADPNCGELEHLAKEHGCTIAVHAEANAIAFAAKHGVMLDGSSLFTTLAPCLPCAKLIINAGIRQVWCGRMYRDRSGVDLLEKAGIDVLAKNF